MSTKHYDSLTALMRDGLHLRIECSCGRVVLLNPGKVLDQALKAGCSHQIDKVAARLRCGDCGARPKSYGPG